MAAEPLNRTPDPMIPVMARVQRRHRELPDVITLQLQPQMGGAWPEFQPGQFMMLYLPGIGEIPVSISGDCTQPQILVHTIRGVGAVSDALCQLKADALLGVRGPFGQGWPVQQAQGQDVIVVAGGLGLAPLRPAIYQLLNQRESYGRVLILYGARSPEDLLFRRELEQWRGRFDVFVDVTVDHAQQSWRGHVGTVNDLIDAAHFDPGDSLAMLCGPEIMMKFCSRSLLDAGVADERIYLSLERNMQCAIGLCGHCQLGADFICRDGPVFSLAHLADRLSRREY